MHEFINVFKNIYTLHISLCLYDFVYGVIFIIIVNSIIPSLIFTPLPIGGGGHCFRSISLFFFICFFVSKIMRKLLDWFAWNFHHFIHALYFRRPLKYISVYFIFAPGFIFTNYYYSYTKWTYCFVSLLMAKFKWTTNKKYRSLWKVGWSL